MNLDLDAQLPSMRKNRNPLYVASRNGLESVLQFLLEHGANPHVVTEGRESTALHAAAYHGRTKCMKLLLAAEGIEQSKLHQNYLGFTYFPLRLSSSLKFYGEKTRSALFW